MSDSWGDYRQTHSYHSGHRPTITGGDNTTAPSPQRYPHPHRVPGDRAEAHSSGRRIHWQEELEVNPGLSPARSRCPLLGGPGAASPSLPPGPQGQAGQGERLDLGGGLPHTSSRTGKPQIIPEAPRTPLSFLSPLSCSSANTSSIPKSPPSLRWPQRSQMLAQGGTFITIILRLLTTATIARHLSFARPSRKCSRSLQRWAAAASG